MSRFVSSDSPKAPNKIAVLIANAYRLTLQQPTGSAAVPYVQVIEARGR